MADGKVQTREISLTSLIAQADPEFYAKRRKEKLWEFSNGRVFRGDPNKINTAYPDE